MIRSLLVAGLLCCLFIEIQIRQDPLNQPIQNHQDIEQYDTDNLDFSRSIERNDLIFYQSLPTSHFNPAFIFLTQSVIESLRRYAEIHFLFYQNVSYVHWRELFRHCFVRIYSSEDVNENEIKFIFGVPHKVFSKLSTRLIFPTDYELGRLYQADCPSEIFSGKLWVARNQGFVYLTNDHQALIPKGFGNPARKQTFLQFSADLIAYLEKVYPSKRRKQPLPRFITGGKFEVAGNKVMISSELPNELTTASWMMPLKSSQFTTLSGANNLNGHLTFNGFLNDPVVQEQLKLYLAEKDLGLFELLRNLDGSLSFGFGTPDNINGDWFLKLNFLKAGHTAQAIGYLKQRMESRGVGFAAQNEARRDFVIRLPFLPTELHVLRRGTSLIFSSGANIIETNSESSIRKSFFAAKLNFALYKEWLKDRWLQLARHYHIRTLKQCSGIRLSEKQKFPVCPLGQAITEQQCPIHGPLDNPSIDKALSDDKRFLIFQDFLEKYEELIFTLSVRENRLEFDLESNL